MKRTRRKGLLSGITRIVIPYMDGNERKYTMITINEPIMANKVYSGIREFVKHNFGVRVNKDWLYHVPMITNSFDKGRALDEATINHLVDRFIEHMECKDEDNDEADTGDQSEAVAATIAALPDMRDGINEAGIAGCLLRS